VHTRVLAFTRYIICMYSMIGIGCGPNLLTFVAAQSWASSEIRVLGTYGLDRVGHCSMPERISEAPRVRIFMLILTFHIGKFELVSHGIHDLMSPSSRVVI
jgi:hypothetical protein